jgi:hypothetical protein
LLSGVLVLIATPLSMLWLAWGVLKSLLTGGTDRALMTLLVRGLIMGILLAMLNNLPAAFGVVVSVGNAVFQTVIQSLQGAF